MRDRNGMIEWKKEPRLEIAKIPEAKSILYSSEMVGTRSPYQIKWKYFARIRPQIK